jgi:putative ABC transport system permease protein
MRLVTFLALAFQRLRHRALLNMLLIVCTALTVGFMLCVPLFAGAVSRMIIQQELTATSQALNRPPLSVRFYAMPTTQRPISWEEAVAYRDWLGNLLSRQTGLPLKAAYAQGESNGLHLRPLEGDDRFLGPELARTRVVCVAGIEEKVRAREGAPLRTLAAEGGAMPVWVSAALADEWGLVVKGRYELAEYFAPGIATLPVVVMGIWEATNPRDPFWYDDPERLLGKALLTTTEHFRAFIAPRTPEGTAFAFWYLVLADERLNFSNAPRYIAGVQRVEFEVVQRLAGGKMDYSPLKELLAGQKRQAALSWVLLGFSAPLMGILLYAISSLAAIVAHSGAQDTAMFVSRGGSRFQVLMLILLEMLILLAIALPLGMSAGLGLAQLLGNSLGFLRFVARPPLELHLAAADWRLVGGAVGASVVARLVPTWMATRESIVGYERQRARRHTSLSALRLLAMVALAVATYYAYGQLGTRGLMVPTDWQPGKDAFRDPLLLLAPALFLFCVPMWGAEVFVVLTRPLALLGKLFRPLAAHLGTLNLARESGQYRAPVYLLVLCLGLGVFYASIAKSAEVWLVDRLRHRIGADVTFQQVSTETGYGAGSEAWQLPVSDYLKISGVTAAARVGEFGANVPQTKGIPALRMLGVDRADFARVALFRPDYAERSLGELMNRLGTRENALLLPQRLMERLALAEGDRVALEVRFDRQWQSVEFVVVGSYRNFPTMVEDKAPLLVTNLDYLYLISGDITAHGAWLRLAPGTAGAQVLREVEGLGVSPLNPKDLGGTIADDRERLERLGIFGLLSVCFLAGAFLAGASLLVQNLASLQAQTVRLAVLRAMGLRPGEVVGAVLVEYLATLAYGLGAGVLAGVASARLYVPFFPLTADPGPPVPPFLPLVDWQSAAGMALVMAAMLVLIEALMLARLMRTRLFEALRLGMRP